MIEKKKKAKQKAFGLISDGQLRFLHEITRPNHPNNPWAGQCQERNALIVDMLVALALRPSELLNILLNDCIIDKPNYSPIIGKAVILKTVFKQKKRIRYIDGYFSKRIHDYVINHRSRIPGSSKSPFLFLDTTNGRPLSNYQFQSIFYKLRKQSPVDFRHTTASTIRKTGI